MRRAKRGAACGAALLTVLFGLLSDPSVMPGAAAQTAVGESAGWETAVGESAGWEIAGAANAGAKTTGAAADEAAGDSLIDRLAITGYLRALADTPDEIPAYYSAAQDGRQPVVRSQGSLSTCWALSAVSALEAMLLPEQHLIFSADHLSLRNDYVITQQDGGDYFMILSYLSGWKGPVLESEDPYGDGVSPEGLSAAVHVQEVRLLAGMSMREIRQMILRFGPVQTSLYMSRASTQEARGLYREETAAYYVPFTKELDHDVLVIGWDDDYPKENFAHAPAQDGAWICQNTWGEDFGEDGIFYVSYEDRNLFSHGGLCYSRVESADNYDAVLSCDSLGWQGRQGYGAGSCYFAAVFTVPEGAGPMELSAAGFYATGPDTIYTVSVVRQFEDTSSFENATPLGLGWIEHAGWYTADLSTKPVLEEGERFAVIVRIETPGADKPVAVELRKDSYTANVTLEGRESYLSRKGEVWENTQEKYGTNVCLKVFLRAAE